MNVEIGAEDAQFSKKEYIDGIFVAVHKIKNRRRSLNCHHGLSVYHFIIQYTLQRLNAENLKQIFPEKEYRGLSPNFHIHVSVSELYIFPRWVCLFCWRKYVD